MASICFKLCICHILLFLLFPQPHLSVALDTLTQGHSLSANQTLVSKGGNFELGFFSSGKKAKQNPKKLYLYIGIWYKRVSKQRIVWVANRDKPAPSTSEFKLSETGNLAILSGFNSNTLIWSTNYSISNPNSTIVVLQDDGNLAVTNKINKLKSVIIWQSFDHPTNTWLPGARLGYNKFTGVNSFLTSWRNSKDPSTGLFSVQIDPTGTSEFFFLANRTQQYWSTGVWNGVIFSAIPEMRSNYFFNFNYVANDSVNYFSYAVRDKSVINNFMLDSSGQMKRRQWDPFTKAWVLYCSLPRDQCDVYGICGPFGVCSNYTSAPCECSNGFKPRLPADWRIGDSLSGCTRSIALRCGEGDGFLKLVGVELPANEEVVQVGSAKECEIACLKNCSCTAFSYNPKCLMWRGDILNLRRILNPEKNGTRNVNLYLRVASSDLPRPQNERKKFVFVAVIIVASLAVLACLIVLTCLLYKRIEKGSVNQTNGALLVFDYKFLKKATRGFVDKLGSGSFGTVYKGTLPDSTPIAVKKLGGLRQGEKQFRAEVTTLGHIHHVNLVRLRGFCTFGEMRLLVYDYMPRGSLDQYLFKDGSEILNWTQRYQIALGVAKGLAYLHEECRECVIHCDIKPENILLDETLNPKVADFGMSKLLGREFSRVLTTLRGTFGYLAPEWLVGLPITSKADVYSFGLLLFEMISGKRNSQASGNGANNMYFPIWAALKLHENNVLCLVDARLEGKVDEEEVERACKIACWCIQDDEAARPAMGKVVQQLEGTLYVDMPPIPSLLHKLAMDTGLGSSEFILDGSS